MEFTKENIKKKMEERELRIYFKDEKGEIWGGKSVLREGMSTEDKKMFLTEIIEDIFE